MFLLHRRCRSASFLAFLFRFLISTQKLAVLFKLERFQYFQELIMHICRMPIIRIEFSPNSQQVIFYKMFLKIRVNWKVCSPHHLSKHFSVCSTKSSQPLGHEQVMTCFKTVEGWEDCENTTRDHSQLRKLSYSQFPNCFLTNYFTYFPF